MIIETERLLLRRFKKEDALDLFEYLQEPLVNCFACMKLETLDDAKKKLEKGVEETEYLFAIVLKENNKVIGEIEAYPEEHGHSDKDTFSPCWMLNKNYHRKGYAYEVVITFLIIYLNKKGIDLFMLILKIIILHHNGYVKS